MYYMLILLDYQHVIIDGVIWLVLLQMSTLWIFTVDASIFLYISFFTMDASLLLHTSFDSGALSLRTHLYPGSFSFIYINDAETSCLCLSFLGLDHCYSVVVVISAIVSCQSVVMDVSKTMSGAHLDAIKKQPYI